jgi:DNA-directed RNA polymerase subunit M/transcription elongation factor TFIIS
MENKHEEYEKYFYELYTQEKISSENFRQIPLHKLSCNPILCERYESSLRMQTEKQNIIESDLYKCPRCGSKKIKVTQYQASRADEAPKVILICDDCGYKWTKT